MWCLPTSIFWGIGVSVFAGGKGGVIHDSWCLKATNSVEGSPDKHLPCLSKPKKSPYPHVGTRYLQFRYLKTNKSTHLVGGFNHFFHDIWDNPSHWLSYFSRWLLHHQPAHEFSIANQFDNDISLSVREWYPKAVELIISHMIHDSSMRIWIMNHTCQATNRVAFLALIMPFVSSYSHWDRSCYALLAFRIHGEPCLLGGFNTFLHRFFWTLTILLFV